MKKNIIFVLGLLFITGCVFIHKGDMPKYINIKYYEQDAGEFYFTFKEKNKCVFNEFGEYEADSIHTCIYDKNKNTITHYGYGGVVTKIEEILYWDSEDMIYTLKDSSYETKKITYRSTTGQFNYEKFAKEVNVKLKNKYENINDTDDHKSEIIFDTQNHTFEYKNISGDFEQKITGSYKIYKDKYNIYPITIVLINNVDSELYFYYSEKGLYSDIDYSEPNYIAAN